MGLPVFMENDTNVFTSAERDMWPDLVHLFLNHDCIGCGILLNGSLIRGVNGFAGELEHLYLALLYHPIILYGNIKHGKIKYRYLFITNINVKAQYRKVAK